jgi:hypothetical protein
LATTAPVLVGVGVKVAVFRGVGVRVLVAVPGADVAVCSGVKVEVNLDVGELLGVTVGVAVLVGVAVTVDVLVTLRVVVRVWVGVAVRVALVVRVAEMVGVSVTVPLAVRVAVIVDDGVWVGVAVLVAVGPGVGGVTCTPKTRLKLSTTPKLQTLLGMLSEDPTSGLVLAAMT